MVQYTLLGSAIVRPNGVVFERLYLHILKIDFDSLANRLTCHTLVTGIKRFKYCENSANPVFCIYF
jgi:hypothetical protein